MINGLKKKKKKKNFTPPMTAIVPRPDSMLMVLPNKNMESQIRRARFTVFATLQLKRTTTLKEEEIIIIQSDR